MSSSQGLQTAIRGIIRAHVSVDDRGALVIPSPDTERAILAAVETANPPLKMMCPVCRGETSWSERHPSGDPQLDRDIACPSCEFDSRGVRTGYVMATQALIDDLEACHASAIRVLERLREGGHVSDPVASKMIFDVLQLDREQFGVHL